jgi:hypothetical protein
MAYHPTSRKVRLGARVCSAFRLLVDIVKKGSITRKHDHNLEWRHGLVVRRHFSRHPSLWTPSAKRPNN